MADTEAISELSGEALAEARGYGIGRLVDEDWATTFVDAFNRLSPPGITFSMREIPRIVYVSGGELLHIDRDYIRAAKEGEAAEYLASLLGSLRESGQLSDERSNQPLTPRVRRFINHRAGSSTRTRVVVQIQDPASPEYPGRHLIDGERVAINLACGVPLLKPALTRDKPSRPSVALGLAIGPGKLISYGLENYIYKACPEFRLSAPGVIEL